MSIIDSKGRLFGKVSIIDILIVLFLISAFGVGFYKLKVLNTNFFSRDREITVVVKSQSALKSTYDAIEIGTVFTEEKSKQEFGTVINKELMPAETYGQKSDGTYLKTTLPDRYDIYLTMKCKAKLTETGYTVGGQDLRITAYYVLKNQKVQQTFYVISIDDPFENQ